MKNSDEVVVDHVMKMDIAIGDVERAISNVLTHFNRATVKDQSISILVQRAKLTSTSTTFIEDLRLALAEAEKASKGFRG